MLFELRIFTIKALEEEEGNQVIENWSVSMGSYTRPTNNSLLPETSHFCQIRCQAFRQHCEDTMICVRHDDEEKNASCQRDDRCTISTVIVAMRTINRLIVSLWISSLKFFCDSSVILKSLIDSDQDIFGFDWLFWLCLSFFGKTPH